MPIFKVLYLQSEAVPIAVTKLGALGDSDDLLDKFDVDISWIKCLPLVSFWLKKCFVVYEDALRE